MRLATDAVLVEKAGHDLELTFGWAGLALAEALSATGDREGASRALAPVVARLTVIASTIADAEHRARFWNRPLPNVSVVRLAAELAARGGREIP